MVLFPDCKINLGLDVLRRRADGYHDIQTLMYPVRGLCDSVEIVRDGTAGADVAPAPPVAAAGCGERPASRGLTAASTLAGPFFAPAALAAAPGVRFSSSGLTLNCPAERNICIRAYDIMRERYGIGPVAMHLHKAIPFGAGLGGGSADGSYVLRGLNELFDLRLDTAMLETLAATLGSDTAFFVRDTPALCTGRGEVVTPFDLPQLDGMWLVIVKPPVAIATGGAYSGLTPAPAPPLAETLALAPRLWRGRLKNDFEATVFAKYPILAQVKEQLYAAGAIYASMSGSGASLYGIFASRPTSQSASPPTGSLFPAEFFIHTERLSAK